MVAEIIGWEVLVPLLLIALFFGSSRIPEVARSLGRARREFERGRDDDPGPSEGDGPPAT